jgi:hypothetical protein
VKTESRHDIDFYRWRLRLAFEQLGNDHVEGAIRFAERALPDLHRKFTLELPQRIETAWGGDYEVFDLLCLELVQAHDEIIAMLKFCWPQGPDSPERKIQ